MTGRPQQGAVRALRVAVLGGSSLALATAAHQLGGGALPGIGELSAVALVLGLAASLITARRVRFPALLGLLGVEQLGLHLVFAASAPAPGCAAGHHGAGLRDCLAAPAMIMDGTVGHGSPAMLIGHALAVLATAWVLSRAENRLWRLAEVAVVAATATVRRIRSGRRGPAVPERPRGLTFSSVFPGSPRGPPVLTV